MASIYNFLGNMIDYLREIYWEVDMGELESDLLSNWDGSTVARVITAIMIGMILASAAMLYERRYIGGFIRALLRCDAKDEESARLLSDIGYGKNGAVKYLLRRRDSALRKLVRCRGETADVAEAGRIKEKIDFSQTAFYIPPALCGRAEMRYEAKGTNWISFLVTVVACLVGGALLIRFLPTFMHILDSIVMWLG